ncbi:MAG TPA: glycosyltransferase family 9 protein [Gemmatimonadaceae bacterium]|nr:glycosyltransferase family 9 protein [Gemmatimonadaceae bacterium]
MTAPPRRVLLMQIRRAGDVVVSTALLEELHRAFPGVQCDWLVGRAAASLLEHHPQIAERLLFDRRDVRETGSLLRARRYDWVIDVQGSWRTALLTRLAGAPVRIGWRGWNRGWAYTHTASRANTAPVRYVVRHREGLLAAAGVHVSGHAVPRLHLSDEESARGSAQVRALSGGLPAVGIVLSTSNRVKDWAPEKFADLASALAATNVRCIVFPTPGGGEQEESFAAAAGGAAAVGPLVPLRELMALVAACDVFVSGDTGPAHIATALGVPRITIYGPSAAEGWTPDSATSIAVRDHAARCLACAGRAPESAHTCLDTVTVGMVLAPVRDLLHTSRGHISGGFRDPEETHERHG